MFYRKNKSKTRTMQTKGLPIQYMAYSSDTIFFPPGDQYRKTVASAAHRTEIEILLLSISDKEIDGVKSPVVRQCVSRGSCLFHPEIGY